MQFNQSIAQTLGIILRRENSLVKNTQLLFMREHELQVNIESSNIQGSALFLYLAGCLKGTKKELKTVAPGTENCHSSNLVYLL